MAKRLFFLWLLLIASNTGFAQGAEMADQMRAEGKIYVVVAILLIILAGLLLYVFLTDRKITALEKKITQK
jgi:uncharacterized transporter YbjL